MTTLRRTGAVTSGVCIQARFPGPKQSDPVLPPIKYPKRVELPSSTGEHLELPWPLTRSAHSGRFYSRRGKYPNFERHWLRHRDLVTRPGYREAEGFQNVFVPVDTEKGIDRDVRVLTGERSIRSTHGNEDGDHEPQERLHCASSESASRTASARPTESTVPGMAPFRTGVGVPETPSGLRSSVTFHQAVKVHSYHSQFIGVTQKEVVLPDFQHRIAPHETPPFALMTEGLERDLHRSQPLSL